MADYITIDGGTTNTRLNLLFSETVVDTLKLPVGARLGLNNKSEYQSSIKRALKELLSKNKREESEIEAIICSGMITSEGGLTELAHIKAPAGIKELSASLFKARIPEISEIPFVFIPGVRLHGAKLSENDMMRGEETELYGLFETPLSNTLYLLPGSHTKLIKTDGQGRISAFSTSLTGEMIAAISENTILKGSLSLSDSKLDLNYLRSGSDYATEHGTSSALFKVRILDKALRRSESEVYSFFLGAILSSDRNNILASPEDTVVIGGTSPLKRAFSLLLRDSGKKIIAVDDTSAERATAIGALKIYKQSIIREKGTTNGKAI